MKDQTAIRRLYLNDSKVTDAGLRAIAGMHHLEWLDLRDAPAVTGAGLAPLEDKTLMKGLLLRRTGVGDAKGGIEVVAIKLRGDDPMSKVLEASWLGAAGTHPRIG